MEVYAVFFLTLFSSVSALRPHSKVYRTDYEYNQNTDAFYKLHAEPRRNSKAVEVCAIEGAQLMKVQSPEDLRQAHGMFKRYPDLTPYAWVARDGLVHEPADERPIIQQSTEDLRQAHGMFKRYPDLTPYAWVARDGLVHEPADERPIIQLSEEVEAPSSALDCDVVTRSGEMETSRCYGWQPFFCKVKAEEAPFNSRCGVYGINYVYVESVGSCYKIPLYAYNWNEAYAECRAEGAHLLVLNSEAESHAVQNLTHEAMVSSSYTPWFYFAGYRAHKPEGSEPVVFKTIFNQTLQEAGFSEWSPNEPNNSHGNEYCGCFFNNNGKLNDVNCNNELGFICENEVHK